MAKGDSLPDQDHVTRWIKPRFVGKNDDGSVIVDKAGRPSMIFPHAFEMREDEESLSITWLEHFGGTLGIQLPLAADAVRTTTQSGTLKDKSGFAIGLVSHIKEAGSKHGAKLRVIEDPINGNSGHSEVRRYPRSADLLYSELAGDTFSLRYLYGEIRQAGWTP